MNDLRSLRSIAVVFFPICGCGYVGDLIYGPVGTQTEEFEPAGQPRARTAIPVPIAAVDIAQESTIRAEDIELRDTTVDDIARFGWPVSTLMMNPDQIEGRITKYKIAAGEPFDVTHLYLEGMAPVHLEEGMEPAPPDLPDRPWPNPGELQLLAYELKELRKTAYETILIPVTSNLLPAGRRLKPSDISFTVMTARQIAERAYPDFEVLIDEQQFLGRTLRKPKSIGRPILLSDFEVSDGIADYLIEQQQ